jgi:membrane-associated phospholipid phosphatase
LNWSGISLPLIVNLSHDADSSRPVNSGVRRLRLEDRVKLDNLYAIIRFDTVHLSIRSEIMPSILQIARCLIRASLLVASVQMIVVNALAQSQPTVHPHAAQPSPPPSLERQFFKNILSDQKAIWTAPLHLHRSDARWLAPISISTAALLATDQETDEFSYNRRRSSISKDISLAGGIYSTGGIAAAFYLAGRVSGNRHARETGLLGAEALTDAVIVYTVLKNVTQRQRPDHDEGQGEFFDGGHSFPSGHATSAWALATVIANEYRSKRAVQISVYGLATAVSISRYTGRNHFLSDVLVGSAIGYGIGSYVYRTHHDRSLDQPDGQIIQPATSKLFPLITPRYNRSGRAYGMELKWSF